MVIGSKPIDGGHYIFDAAGRQDFLRRQPEAEPYLRPFVGAEEYLNGGQRWILALGNASPTELKAMLLVAERVAAVKKTRLESTSASTRALAATPTRFHVTVIPGGPFLCVPKVSSERRDYVPIGWLEPPVIPSDLVFVLLDADLWHFAVLTSAMHMAWLRHIGGRLESRYRYSIGIVYNTFPWPVADEPARQRVRGPARAVLDARAQFPKETLAALYDPDLMPPDLRKAHQALDRAVDRLYRPAGFTSDRERVEHLFGMYEKAIR
jgi:hypothetical protein